MVEAIIGAVYLDSNRSFKVTWQTIQRILGDQLNASFEDVHLNPVRVLFEEVPGEKQVVFKKSNDNVSDTSYYTVMVNGFGTFIARGKNYQVAKKRAALKALKEIHRQKTVIA
nr:endoribonuclease dcr-1-like isoform X1 [Penaeus vannamei]